MNLRKHRSSPTTIVNLFINWHFCLDVFLIYCRLLRQVSSTLLMQWFISHYLIQSSGPEVTQMISMLQKHKVVFIVVFVNVVFISFQPCFVFPEGGLSVWKSPMFGVWHPLSFSCCFWAEVFILKSSCWFNASQIEEMMNGFSCLDLVPFKSLNRVSGKLLIILKSTQFGF